MPHFGKWIEVFSLMRPVEDLLTARIDARSFKGKLSLILVLLALCYLFNWSEFFHTYWRLRAYISDWPYDVNPWLLEKISHPFTQLETSADHSDHFEKLAFRFIPFVIANILHLNPVGLYFFQFAMGIIFPLVIWAVVFDATKSMSIAATGAILINSLYCGFSFFFDRVFFDAFAYFFLALAMFFNNRISILLLLILAAFTDERAIVAGGLVACWHLLRSDTLTMLEIKKWLLFLLLFAATYVFLRLIIGHVTGLRMGANSVGIDNLKGNLPHITLLIWSIFEGGWFIVGLAGLTLIDKKSIPERFLFGACLLCLVGVFGAGMIVGDSIRSHQYAFPLLLIALGILGKHGGVIPLRVQRAAILFTLLTPITIYLGFEPVGDRLIYNMWPLKPGYLAFLP